MKDPRLIELQCRLGLPLPSGLPKFVHEDGLERLQEIQKKGLDDALCVEFQKWVFDVCRCFGFNPRKAD
ncbi:MAG: hypothetical protein ACK449_00720 [Planctomycetota bacterium]|jgi:hypothetical protein